MPTRNAENRFSKEFTGGGPLEITGAERYDLLIDLTKARFRPW